MKNTTIIKLVLSILICSSLGGPSVGMEEVVRKQQEVIQTDMTGTLFFLEDSGHKYLFINTDTNETYSAYDPYINPTLQKHELFSKFSDIFFGKGYRTPEDLVGKKVTFRSTGKQISIQNTLYSIAKITSAIPEHKKSPEPKVETTPPKPKIESKITPKSEAK